MGKLQEALFGELANTASPQEMLLVVDDHLRANPSAADEILRLAASYWAAELDDPDRPLDGDLIRDIDREHREAQSAHDWLEGIARRFTGDPCADRELLRTAGLVWVFKMSAPQPPEDPHSFHLK